MISIDITRGKTHVQRRMLSQAFIFCSSKNMFSSFASVAISPEFMLDARIIEMSDRPLELLGYLPHDICFLHIKIMLQHCYSRVSHCRTSGLIGLIGDVDIEPLYFIIDQLIQDDALIRSSVSPTRS